MNHLKIILTAALACAVTLPLNGALISNGGFEAGLSGWTRADQVGSDGSFFIQTGTTSPVLGEPVPEPPEGLNAAMTDAEAGGSHVLYQDFVVPTGFSTAILNFDLFIHNWADEYVTPNTLDWSTVRNQQFRVDILRPTSDPFSLAGSDVLMNAYRTEVGDPLEFGYNTIAVDLTAVLQANAGDTLRLRFAEVDNLLFLNVGIDSVDIELDGGSAIPEPSSILLVAGALTALIGWRRRSQNEPNFLHKRR